MRISDWSSDVCSSDLSLQLLMPVRLLAPVRAGLGEGEQVEKDHEHPDQLRLTIPITVRLRGGRTEILGSAKPTVHRDPVLIKALRAAPAMVAIDPTRDPTLASPHD